MRDIFAIALVSAMVAAPKAPMTTTTRPQGAEKDLPLALSHAITRIFREQNRLHGRTVQSFGLSTEQAHLLLVLWTYGPLTMTELGKEVALSSGTLSAAVDRMEASGLVTRVKDERDGRSVRVEPAPWPKAKRDKLAKALAETEDALFAALSTAEKTLLVRLLDRVLKTTASTRSVRYR